jgi:hypothetical protein
MCESAAADRRDAQLLRLLGQMNENRSYESLV